MRTSILLAIVATVLVGIDRAAAGLTTRWVLIVSTPSGVTYEQAYPSRREARHAAGRVPSGTTEIRRAAR